MKMNPGTLSSILVAHREAMAAYRKEYMRLGRNAIEIMLYAYGKSGITATEISRNLLHTNISQTKTIINQLVLKKILFMYGKGVKGKPKRYWLSDIGVRSINDYLKGFITMDKQSAYNSRNLR